MTSGKAGTEGWRLTFERRSAPYVEPLMGWTGDDDPLAIVELSFPTLRSAIRYAERQKLPYVVEATEEQNANQRQSVSRKMKHAFSDETLERLGLGSLQESYDKAIAGAEARHDQRGEEGWAWPMAVVCDPSLSLDAKRSILIDWAWTEYLIDQTTMKACRRMAGPRAFTRSNLRCWLSSAATLRRSTPGWRQRKRLPPAVAA
ncbi:NADH dehydrogenase ubiquinone Fe-S protein 4 [Bradyrhizobium sp. sGM-13]|uniref:NADH dehydrogenase ubiquinone Fe-S protein 4 n=1 Tax=Bradyrhizobium sp. sGM-13 TaxID=2831781 RepID=UPI0020BE0D83|nr:NADH dehydrogenase ubiquinone Fe-S protein 4 [Bradyrhizobium sp. sGM-13]